ncbi:uncharacterized protein N7484_005784 [Penicillium longicatenatum]|uniref:uncharacterized protein n=1 Tax=Penicillium longicatenatum TaxID=1561947 RepID=UPI0025467A71|nr:uncharacterized protein N7484_005784 [Penicillium longicatenatum]KAJ5643277.1 hypothetical protein N7484_005784 [Penicillium longicatenatum]
MHQKQTGCTYAQRADLVEKLQGLRSTEGLEGCTSVQRNKLAARVAVTERYTQEEQSETAG